MRKVLRLKGGEFIEVNLSKESKGIVLSISGVLENSSGQNYEDIYNEYIIGNPKFTKKAKLSRLLILLPNIESVLTSTMIKKLFTHITPDLTVNPS